MAIETKVIIDNKGVYNDPRGDEDRPFSSRQVDHCAKDFPEKDTSSCKLQHREERMDKHKGCLHLLKVIRKKKLIQQCFKQINVFQANREEDEYYQQLSQ